MRGRVQEGGGEGEGVRGRRRGGKREKEEMERVRWRRGWMRERVKGRRRG